MRSISMIIYLYKKTHKNTGFKYLGKTVQNPYKYRGSGKDWKAHIKQHGYHVDTEILKECLTQDELSFWGRYYSNLWNIVERDDWANKIPETGGGPGFKSGSEHPNFGKKESPETTELRASTMRGIPRPQCGRSGDKNSFFGKTHTDAFKKKMSDIGSTRTGEKNGMFNKKHKNSTKELMSKNHADVSGEKNPNYGRKKSPEEIARRTETRARNRANKT